MTKSTDLGVQSDLPAKTTEIDEMQAKIDRMLPHYHPRSVRQEALLKVAELSDEGSNAISIGDAVTQALVLKEFDLGILMGMSLPDHLKTFAIQLSLDLQRDYKCESAGKKSLAEAASINYCSTLDVQRKLNDFLSKESYGDLTVKIIGALSKELDRAQRHYLTSMQALETGLQPPLNLSVRTQVANIAQQQLVQDRLESDRKEYGI